ncbi:putative protein FAM172B [Scyliorhinus canicula]|uniref:putative protein FAM172B n=1 Tax=Scyliorhinus canicula TaxID=7830 RepID=UPI0018F77906|nr:putative protein FAM172B [Scyliorhinus canicula]
MEGTVMHEQLENAKRLKEFKYYFNDKGQLRHTETNQPFDYKRCSNSMKLNHQWYKAFGTILAHYVYELLEKECRLKRVYIPLDTAENGDSQSFCFMTEGALTNPSKLIVLLQDRGVMRAGTWSQQLIVHDSLNTGTQIPFIKQALVEQYEVMVLNVNDNFTDIKQDDGAEEQTTCDSDQQEHNLKLEQIPKLGFESLEAHTIYVWDHFISTSPDMSVAFIVHGYGGLAFVNLLNERKDVMSKVYAVAFINSAHDVDHQNVGQIGRNWIGKRSRHWLLSAKPLDKLVPSVRTGCAQVSAGTQNHDLAPTTCLHSVFKYLKKISNVQKTNPFVRSPIVTRSFSRKLRARTKRKRM